MKRKIVVAGIAVVVLFIGLCCLHYHKVEKSTPEILEATVARKYTKTRHHTRRINRRVYTTGEPYKVYYFELELQDGSKKDLQVSMQKYNRTRYGSKIKVSRRKGLFGIPVVKADV